MLVVGAEWYQFVANWGNWQYFSGVGTDPKKQHFRTMSQPLQYDPNGHYVMKWFFTIKRNSRGIGLGLLSEEGNTNLFQNILDQHQSTKEVLFRPWDFVSGWYTVVDPSTQYTWTDRQRLKQTGQPVIATDATKLDHSIKEQ
jgi:FAD binding domain of DNA photolyase